MRENWRENCRRRKEERGKMIVLKWKVRVALDINMSLRFQEWLQSDHNCRITLDKFEQLLLRMIYYHKSITAVWWLGVSLHDSCRVPSSNTISWIHIVKQIQPRCTMARSITEKGHHRTDHLIRVIRFSFWFYFICRLSFSAIKVDCHYQTGSLHKNVRKGIHGMLFFDLNTISAIERRAELLLLVVWIQLV